MSGSRVRENRMHGLTGGRWRSGSHGEPEPSTRRETRGTEPGHLPLADQPAAYLTRGDHLAWSAFAWSATTTRSVDAMRLVARGPCPDERLRIMCVLGWTELDCQRGRQHAPARPTG